MRRRGTHRLTSSGKKGHDIEGAWHSCERTGTQHAGDHRSSSGSWRQTRRQTLESAASDVWPPTTARWLSCTPADLRIGTLSIHAPGFGAGQLGNSAKKAGWVSRTQSTHVQVQMAPGARCHVCLEPRVAHRYFRSEEWEKSSLGGKKKGKKPGGAEVPVRLVSHLSSLKVTFRVGVGLSLVICHHSLPLS